MWPTFGPLPAYGLIYLTAFLVHYVVSWRIARSSALEWRVWITVGALGSFSSVFGGKILYDVSHYQFNWHALLNSKHYMEGGLWGGLLVYFALAVPAVLLLTRKRCQALDLVALSLPIPTILARLGCLLHGCCYGKPCSLPWGIVFPEHSRGAPAGIPLHPTQVYEMIVMVIALLAFKRLAGGRWRGTMLLWFLLIYGFGRALCDVFRGDFGRQIYLGSLSLTQLICLGAAVVSVALLARRWRVLQAGPGPTALEPKQNGKPELPSAVQKGE